MCHKRLGNMAILQIHPGIVVLLTHVFAADTTGQISAKQIKCSSHGSSIISLVVIFVSSNPVSGLHTQFTFLNRINDVRFFKFPCRVYYMAYFSQLNPPIYCTYTALVMNNNDVILRSTQFVIHRDQYCEPLMSEYCSWWPTNCRPNDDVIQ